MRSTLKRLEMLARGSIPKPVRQAYRIARTAIFTPVPSPELPQALVAGCEVVASRLDLLDRLPKSGRVAEVGTYKGDFAREILARAAPNELHVIDIDYSRFDRALNDDPRIVRHEGLSHDVMAHFPEAHFDWIYIDADHAYDGVKRDARVSASRVKPGGFLVFNDYAHIDPNVGRYGVHRAVTEFAVEMRWPLRYFALNPYALYDVALQRP